MIKNENKKINKIEKLVEIIATNVFKLTDKVDNIEKNAVNIKKDTRELKESNKDIKKDILNLGDRFVSYHAFDVLASRVKILEEKTSNKY